MPSCNWLPRTGVEDVRLPETYRATTASQDAHSKFGISTRPVLRGWWFFRHPAAPPEARPAHLGPPRLGPLLNGAPGRRDFPAPRGQMLPSAPDRCAVPSTG